GRRSVACIDGSSPHRHRGGIGRDRLFTGSSARLAGSEGGFYEKRRRPDGRMQAIEHASPLARYMVGRMVTMTIRQQPTPSEALPARGFFCLGTASPAARLYNTTSAQKAIGQIRPFMRNLGGTHRSANDLHNLHVYFFLYRVLRESPKPYSFAGLSDRTCSASCSDPVAATNSSTSLS